MSESLSQHKDRGARRAFFVLFLSVSIFCPLTSAFSTTFISLSAEDRIRKAEWICAVVTVAMPTEQVAGHVVTHAEVRPLECFKGGPSDLKKTFSVSWPGGVATQKDAKGKVLTDRDGTPLRIRTFVAGTPTLKVGDAAILYLWRASPRDEFTVLSWAQGSIPLTYNKAKKSYELPENQAEVRSPKNDASESEASDTLKLKNSDGLRIVSSRSLEEFRLKVKRVLSEASESP